MFSELLRQGQFEPAEDLLVSEIRRAELVDPADDFSWGVAADALAYRLLAARGAEAFRDFHQRLLDVFIEELEPRWGHLHKGHLYYRLASGSLAADFDVGLDHLRAAVAEDRLKAAASSGSSTVGPPANQEISAAQIALVTLEAAYREHADDESWRQLLEGVAWLRFEVALENMTVREPDTVWALGQLIPTDSLPALSGLHEELNTAVALGMAYGLPALLSEYWAQLLLGIVRDTEVESSFEDGLSAQLDAALHGRIPMTTEVISAFRLAALWRDTALDRGALVQPDARSVETARLVAVTLKVMVDRAVLVWAKSKVA